MKMLSPRKIDIKADRDMLLELHCQINYESDSPWAREIPFEQYREKWLSTSQPEVFLKDLTESMKDERTIAEIWEDSGVVAGYLWVIFSEISGYGITVAELKDIIVTTDYRRRGIAKKMLAHAEQLSCERGADIFRSGTGTENLVSQKLLTGSGFKPHYIQYEKLLHESH
jgi:ribosomal protein S18 acetylase RimI-like enzyme